MKTDSVNSVHCRSLFTGVCSSTKTSQSGGLIDIYEEPEITKDNVKRMHLCYCNDIEKHSEVGDSKVTYDDTIRFDHLGYGCKIVY